MRSLSLGTTCGKGHCFWGPLVAEVTVSGDLGWSRRSLVAGHTPGGEELWRGPLVVGRICGGDQSWWGPLVVGTTLAEVAVSGDHSWCVGFVFLGTTCGGDYNWRLEPLVVGTRGVLRHLWWEALVVGWTVAEHLRVLSMHAGM